MRVPHLVFAWSLDEPSRVGEAIAIVGTVSIGRGEPLSDDPAPRAMPRRMRPGTHVETGALHNARISRVHLVVTAEGDAVRVRSLGRAPLRINGQIAEHGTARAGDVIELHNAASFVVVLRPGTYPPARTPGGFAFEFGRPDRFGIAGESEAVWALRDALAFAAASDRHVLLLGATGAGKELAARAIHGTSARSGGPFVSRNAATLPEALVDAELFGSAKNYPNAGMPERVGLVGESDGGTLFLDEIGDLPEKAQVHLLRVLDADGEYQRLGESKSRRSSLRLVAATNRDPASLRSDFLARFPQRVTVPSLSERPEDIPLILTQLLERIADRSPELVARFFERRGGARAEPRIAPDLVTRLVRHSFSHNVRELDRLLWLAIGSAEGDYLGLSEAVEAELGDPPESAAEAAAISREDLVRALREHGPSPTRVARALSLKNRYVLHRLLKKHGLASGTGEEAP